MQNVIEEISAERARQINEEGWTPEHDDSHVPGDLAKAASCYALSGVEVPTRFAFSDWPWNLASWKPTNPRHNLVRAGALIVAEIERLDRAAKTDT